MKVCNTSACEACESYGSHSFKLLEFPCGRIARPKKKADRLIFIISGKLSVEAHEQEEFTCKEGEFILLVREKKYDVHVLKKAKLLVLSFVTSYQICDKMSLKEAKPIIDAIQYKFCSLEIREPLKMMLDSMIYYLNDDIRCNYWQRAKNLEFFVVFWNYYTIEEICRFFYPVINKEIGFHTKVMANYTKAKTVKELAQLCGYSLTTFNKLFTEHLPNISPYQWMLQQNRPLIKAQLLDKTIPIKVIIDSFGFIDHPHFNKYCNKHFGGTAIQIREGKE